MKVRQSTDTFSRSLRVQFIGLPGAGKTTLCKLLESHLSRLGYTVENRSNMDKWMSQRHAIYKTWLRLRYGLIYLSLIRPTLRFISTIKPLKIEVLKRSIRPALSLITQKTYSSKNSFEFLLMDQGELQEIWSLIVSSREYSPKSKNDFILEIINKSDNNDVIIYLKSSGILSSKRVSTRKHGDSRFEKIDNYSREEIFSRYNNFFDDLCCFLKNNRRFVLELDAIDNLEKNISLILKTLESQTSTLSRAARMKGHSCNENN
jgi:thymidylate kinase